MHERAGSAVGYATAALWQKPPSSRGALALKVGTVKDMRTQQKHLMNFSQKKPTNLATHKMLKHLKITKSLYTMILWKANLGMH